MAAYAIEGASRSGYAEAIGTADSTDAAGFVDAARTGRVASTTDRTNTVSAVDSDAAVAAGHAGPAARPACRG